MTTAPRPAKLTPQIAAVLLVAASAVAVRLYLMATTRSTAEDFYITLRYAENLARGLGFVYNPGERVLGTTTPLYTLYLACAARIGPDPVLFGKAANILADGGTVWMLYRLARAAGWPGAGLVAGALLAISPPNITWAISGMETSLVTLAVVALFAATAERRSVESGIWAALLVLLRIDGLLAVLVAFGALWRRERRFPMRAALAFGVIIAPWLLFATAYFGSPVPTSAIAKLTVYAWFAKSPFPNIRPFIYQMAHTRLHLVVLLLALAGAAIALARIDALRPAVVWMLLYDAAMALSKGFLFGWYFIPPAPVYFLLALIAATAGMRRIARALHRPALPPLLAPCAALLVLLVGLRGLPAVRRDLADAQSVEENLRKPIGLALRTLVPRGERIMLEPIGYIGYFSEARILDAVGLVSPEAIPYYRRGVVSPYLDMMATLRPEFVLLRAGEYADALAAPVPQDRALGAHYRLVRTFADPAAPVDAAPAFYLLRREPL